MFCGDHLLAAKLRRSSIDASAGAVEDGHITANDATHGGGVASVEGDRKSVV